MSFRQRVTDTIYWLSLIINVGFLTFWIYDSIRSNQMSEEAILSIIILGIVNVVLLIYSSLKCRRTDEDRTKYSTDRIHKVMDYTEEFSEEKVEKEPIPIVKNSANTKPVEKKETIFVYYKRSHSGEMPCRCCYCDAILNNSHYCVVCGNYERA